MTDFMKKLTEYDRNQIEEELHKNSKCIKLIPIAYRLRPLDKNKEADINVAENS